MWYLALKKWRSFDAGEHDSADDGYVDMRTVIHDCSLMWDYDYDHNALLEDYGYDTVFLLIEN